MKLLNDKDKLTDNVYYVPPGAGSVALACKHNVRYPDICPDCVKK